MILKIEFPKPTRFRRTFLGGSERVSLKSPLWIPVALFSLKCHIYNLTMQGRETQLWKEESTSGRRWSPVEKRRSFVRVLRNLLATGTSSVKRQEGRGKGRLCPISGLLVPWIWGYEVQWCPAITSPCTGMWKPDSGSSGMWTGEKWMVKKRRKRNHHPKDKVSKTSAVMRGNPAKPSLIFFFFFWQHNYALRLILSLPVIYLTQFTANFII